MANEEQAILAAARQLYEALPAAEFTSVTLRQLAEASDRGDDFKTLPNSVKLCVIKLVIALGMQQTNETTENVPAVASPETSQPIEAEIIPPNADEPKTD